tara:strand:+ start:3251 stop:3715 length:465 start_codon:yes stop_codon:yes gene_type:complete
MMKHPDYSKGQIYKLTNPDCTDIYIGSSVRRLSRRLWAHRDHATLGRKSYGNIFETDNYTIEKIEDFPCESSEQLRKREREILELTKSMCPHHTICNQHSPWRNEEERKRLHKEAITRYYKTERGKEKKKYQNKRYYQKRKSIKDKNKISITFE